MPTTTGNSGKFLSTDGTDYTWAEIADANTVLYFPSTISSSETWATAGQRFSYDSLTVGSGATYTISGTGSIHYVTTGLAAFS